MKVWGFFPLVMLRAASHHSRLDQNLPKGCTDTGKWSEASWWKQVTLFSLFPLSRQHFCRRRAFRKAMLRDCTRGFSSLGNGSRIGNCHQHTGICKLLPLECLKAFFGQVKTKEMPFSVMEESKLTTSIDFPTVASQFPRPSIPIIVWALGHLTGMPVNPEES